MDNNWKREFHTLCVPFCLLMTNGGVVEPEMYLSQLGTGWAFTIYMVPLFPCKVSTLSVQTDFSSSQAGLNRMCLKTTDPCALALNY